MTSRVTCGHGNEYKGVEMINTHDLQFNMVNIFSYF